MVAILELMIKLRILPLLVIIPVIIWNESPRQGSVNDGTATSFTNQRLPSENLGWLNLFDGKTLFGWVAESEADWHVVEGEIRVTNGSPGLLRTTTQFGRFELKLEFQASDLTNSGVFLLTSPRPTSPLVDCYEINIINPQLHEFATGSLVGRQKSTHAPHLEQDDWHSMHAIVNGDNIEIRIDDNVACVYEDPKPLGRGFIGLQFNGGSVSFRNIVLRPLHDQPDTDPNLLSHWNQDLLNDARADQIDDKTIHLTGGLGQLESRETFADFVLSLQCRLNRKDVNSGIFFRCIPNELLNGYECQLNNSELETGSAQPADCGTGGIFRRQDARTIVAQDEEWFSLTIIATGPHIATWVNGVQVVDWTDKRKPGKNPRRGLRLEAGTIAFQGHDASTDAEFRSIQISEMEKRNR